VPRSGEILDDRRKELANMAMVRVTPTEVSVTCDPFDGAPRGVRMAEDMVPVLGIDRVRDESAAYPLASGPRTVFEVRTPDARLRLSFGHRDRRWTVEGVDADLGLPIAA
jgi:hypothetical protein